MPKSIDMKVLFCASEVTPFAKTGGLADVAGALPPALKRLGCDVRVFMPLYRTARDRVGSLRPVVQDLTIPVGVHDYTVHIWETRSNSGIPVYLLEKDEFFDRGHLYGSPERGDYEDNAERFITFSRTVHPLCEALNWFPDIFHLHDWQTALVAVYQTVIHSREPNFARSRTVFTIHNLAYQGLFPAAQFSLTHLPPEVYSMGGMEFWGKCCFLKGGLSYGDFLTTVSPGYAAEIQTPENGCGLEGVLRSRSDDLAGILNGVDTDVWNPETDEMTAARFSVKDLSGKRVCKDDLLYELGFPTETRSKPLLGMISRFATQKGFDLLVDVLEELMALPLSLIILGTGDSKIEKQLKKIEKRYPMRLKVLTRFDESLAHKIEAGADIFLMPSRYEPCGLNQMYSLMYGTIPVVHATGGLDDSVTDVTDAPEEGTGFKFREYKPEAFMEKVTEAIKLFRNAVKWRETMKRAMSRDFSWSRSAREYLAIYENLSARPPRVV